MRHSAIFLAMLVASVTVSAQATHKFSAGKTNEYGLKYSLPNTTMDITLEAVKTVKTPGEFFRYAKKYLGEDPITEPSTSYELVSVTMNPRAIPDPEDKEGYLVQFKSGSAPFMILDDNGFPLSVNTEETLTFTPEAIPVAKSAAPTILETPAAKQAVTAEMLKSPSSAKRAELAASRIYELRETRSEILSGSADNMPADGKAMQLVLDNLDAQEAALTAMFLGTTQTSTEVTTINSTPGKTNPRKVLARLSMTEGFVGPDDLSGAPIYLDITITEQGEYPKNEKQEVKRFPKDGLAYRIPGKANVKVSYNDKKMLDKDIDVAQYGIVFGLDPDLFTDKKNPAKAIFVPLTGAIKEVVPVTPRQ